MLKSRSKRGWKTPLSGQPEHAAAAVSHRRLMLSPKKTEISDSVVRQCFKSQRGFTGRNNTGSLSSLGMRCLLATLRLAKVDLKSRRPTLVCGIICLWPTSYRLRGLFNLSLSSVKLFETCDSFSTEECKIGISLFCIIFKSMPKWCWKKLFSGLAEHAAAEVVVVV